MSLKKDVFDAEVKLDMTLDPPAGEWELVPISKEVYNSSDYQISFEEQREPNFTVVRFSLKRKDSRKFTLKNYILSVHSYMHDIHRIWIPDQAFYIEFMYLTRAVPFMDATWHIYDPRSSANLRAPIILGLNRRGLVTLGVGFVDQRIETSMTAKAATHYPWPLERGRMTLQLRRPLDGYVLGPFSEYKDAYFVTKGSFWFNTMQNYGKVHAEIMKRPVNQSPDPCWEPLWMPWAAKPGEWSKTYHEDVDEELLLKAMEIGAKLGIKTVHAYMYSFPKFARSQHPLSGYPEKFGDYLPDPEKFTDFRGLARKLHRMGVWITVWLYPFIVGKESEARKNLEDALFVLPRSNPRYEELSSHLCPRNPKAQKHMAELVARVLRDYEVDGYCMDNMNNVPLEACMANHTHNFSSNGIALDYCFALMKEAIDRVKPDAIIEWRQPYANINNLNYASAFRAYDSGDTGDYELDRRLCVFLRSYIPPGKAVHTDPIWWRIDEDDKTVAKMLSTIVVSGVPQLGVDLINIPDSHRELIKVWLRFYQQNKQDFRYGQMRPIQNDPQFSTIMVSSPGKAFISYGNYPALRVPLTKDANEIYLFNCTLEDSLYTILQGISGEYEAELYDHTLSLIGEKKTVAKNEEVLIDLNVPQGGYSLLKKT